MISAILRASIFVCVLVGPLCAMKFSQQNTFGDESNAVGLVLLNSLQRG